MGELGQRVQQLASVCRGQPACAAVSHLLSMCFAKVLDPALDDRRISHTFCSTTNTARQAQSAKHGTANTVSSAQSAQHSTVRSAIPAQSPEYGVQSLQSTDCSNATPPAGAKQVSTKVARQNSQTPPWNASGLSPDSSAQIKSKLEGTSSAAIASATNKLPLFSSS